MADAWTGKEQKEVVEVVEEGGGGEGEGDTTSITSESF